MERRSHPLHRHVQELYLTDAGREVLHAADAVIAAIEHQVITRLGPGDTARFTAMLGEVAAAARDTPS